MATLADIANAQYGSLTGRRYDYSMPMTSGQSVVAPAVTSSPAANAQALGLTGRAVAYPYNLFLQNQLPALKTSIMQQARQEAINKQMDEMASTYKNKLLEQQEQYNAAVSGLRSQQASQAATYQEQYNAAVQGLQDQYLKNIEEQNKTVQDLITKKQAEYEAALKGQQAQYEASLKEWDDYYNKSLADISTQYQKQQPGTPTTPAATTPAPTTPAATTRELSELEKLQVLDAYWGAAYEAQGSPYRYTYYQPPAPEPAPAAPAPAAPAPAAPAAPATPALPQEAIDNPYSYFLSQPNGLVLLDKYLGEVAAAQGSQYKYTYYQPPTP